MVINPLQILMHNSRLSQKLQLEQKQPSVYKESFPFYIISLLYKVFCITNFINSKNSGWNNSDLKISDQKTLMSNYIASKSIANSFILQT